MGIERIGQRKIESPESENKNEMVAEEFLGLSAAELENVRSRIEAVQGHVRIAVHPLYIGRHPDSFSAKSSGKTHEEANSSLEDGFIKMVHSVAQNEKSAPLLVFEEENFINETKEMIRGLIDADGESLAKKGFLFFETEKSQGALAGSLASRAYQEKVALSKDEAYEALALKKKMLLEQSKALWDDLSKTTPPKGAPTEAESKRNLEVSKKSLSIIEEFMKIEKELESRRNAVLTSIFEALSIRSALISGGYFYTYPKAMPEEVKRLQGCAGSVAQSLRDSGLEVDISRFAWPPRESLKESGHTIKQTGSKKNERS